MPVNKFIKFQVTKSLLHSICVSKEGGQELEVSDSICYMGTGELALCSTLPRSQPSGAVPAPWPRTSLPREPSPKKLIDCDFWRATQSPPKAFMVPTSLLFASSILMRKKIKIYIQLLEMWRGALHKLLHYLLHHQVSLRTAVQMLYQATRLIMFHYKSHLLYWWVVTFFWLHLSKESGKRNIYAFTLLELNGKD